MILQQSTKTTILQGRHRPWFCHEENVLVDDQKHGSLKSKISLFLV